ncbi:MAG: DUF3990 domain-containing protein [Clostridium sp.]|nr:DUF3990 domain-containing protein [Clostridium sp.]
MNLYHGTILEYANNIIKNGVKVDFKEANRGTDFGIGFYTTNFYELARKTALTKSFYHKDDYFNNTPVVLCLKFDRTMMKDYNVKTFNNCKDEWKKFICANRYSQVRLNKQGMDSNFDLKYDMVIGAVADSVMADIRKQLIKDQYVLKDGLLNSIYPLKIGNTIPIQISFHSQELADCIRVLHYDII